MDGTQTAEGLTPEASAEVQRVYELLRKATEDEPWRLAQLMVSKQDGEWFGQAEFQVRDHLLRMGAKALDYPTYVRNGWQIGSGPVESACKTVVGNRLKGGGMRWGEEVPLTGKEFRLLEYFVRRSGRALARNTILDAVWGRSVIVTARSVDRCVTTLRGKIESDPARPKWIRTIRSIGYRFEMPEPHAE